MKINFFNLAVVVVLCAMLAWLVVLTSDFEDGKLALAAVSFCTFLATTSGGYAIKWPEERSGIVCKVLSNVALLLFLILNFVFAFLNSFSIPLYIVLNVVLLCIYALWTRWVYSTKE